MENRCTFCVLSLKLGGFFGIHISGGELKFGAVTMPPPTVPKQTNDVAPRILFISALKDGYSESRDIEDVYGASQPFLV